jgi:molybdenum cofactor biosynthesis enzyme MoaA
LRNWRPAHRGRPAARPDPHHQWLAAGAQGAALKDAGLNRVTVSLDGLDDAVFRRMNDVDFPVADVLAGIEAAHAAGLSHIKVNMVVKRGTNDHEILAHGAALSRHGHHAALH